MFLLNIATIISSTKCHNILFLPLTRLLVPSSFSNVATCKKIMIKKLIMIVCCNFEINCGMLWDKEIVATLLSKTHLAAKLMLFWQNNWKHARNLRFCVLYWSAQLYSSCRTHISPWRCEFERIDWWWFCTRMFECSVMNACLTISCLVSVLRFQC